MGKRTPEDRDRLRRLIEDSEAARENMQTILDRIVARRRADQERREIRRRLIRRLLPFRRAA
jgi:hypothetical protein